MNNIAKTLLQNIDTEISIVEEKIKSKKSEGKPYAASSRNLERLQKEREDVLIADKFANNKWWDTFGLKSGFGEGFACLGIFERNIKTIEPNMWTK